jgi:hypothetical protein
MQKLIEKAERKSFALKLAMCQSHEARRKKVEQLMASEGVAVADRNGLYGMRLLGRKATSTTEHCVISNWIAAVMKEAGLDG